MVVDQVGTTTVEKEEAARERGITSDSPVDRVTQTQLSPTTGTGPTSTLKHGKQHGYDFNGYCFIS